MAARVYHWKHGWIPLDHAAALSKSKGNHDAAARMLGDKAPAGLQGIRREHLRRESHITAGVKGSRVALQDSKTGHTIGISSDHAASLHSQGHTITSVNDGSFTTRNDYGHAAQFDRNGKPVASPSEARAQREQVGITQSRHLAFGNSVAGTSRNTGGGYTESQRVEHQVQNFHKPGFPIEWQSGHIEKISPRDGGLSDLTIRHDDGTVGTEIVGKRGGNKKLRTLSSEPANVADARTVTSQQRSHDLMVAAIKKRAEAERIAGGAGVAERAAGRLNPTNLATAHRNTDSSLRRYTEASNAAQGLEFKAGRAQAKEQEASRVRLTHDQIKGANQVRDRHGWHEVVRVNGKTVTVKTAHSWTETIPHDKIHEVRRFTPAQLQAVIDSPTASDATKATARRLLGKH